MKGTTTGVKNGTNPEVMAQHNYCTAQSLSGGLIQTFSIQSVKSQTNTLALTFHILRVHDQRRYQGENPDD